MRDVHQARGAAGGSSQPWRLFMGALWLLSACHASPRTSADPSTTQRPTPMETQQLMLRVQEPHEVTLPSRGASGLQLLFAVEPAGVVSVVRRELSAVEQQQVPAAVGGAMPAVFVLTGLEPGRATVRFYEKPAPGRGGPAEIPVATYQVTVGQ